MDRPIYGVWPSPPDAPVSGDDPEPIAMLGWLMLRLQEGSESIVDQVGGMVSAIEVAEPGRYVLHLDPAVHLAEPDRFYVLAQPYDVDSRVAVVSVETASFTLHVFNAPGQRSDVDRCALAIYFDPWTPTKETGTHDDALSRMATGGPAAARMGNHQRSHRRRGETGWRYLRHVFSRRAGPDPDGVEDADRGK